MMTRKEQARFLRRELVHAAGCTESDCASKSPDALEWNLSAYRDLARPPRVPRSLRALFASFKAKESDAQK
jgi:hypothetical protein